MSKKKLHALLLLLFFVNNPQNGELATGDFEDQLDPTICEHLKGKRIVCISAGEQHSLAVRFLQLLGEFSLFFALSLAFLLSLRPVSRLGLCLWNMT
jgi:hypothetical protein